MRITFVIQDMFAQGAQHVTALMVKGFVDRGYEVDLIVSKVHRDYIAKGREDSFAVPEKTNWIHLKYRKARNNILQLRKYLKTTDSTAIICMSHTYTQAFRVASVGVSTRPLIVHVEHGVVGITDIGAPRPAHCRISPIGIVYQWLWSGIDKVFVVSRAAVKDFCRMNPWYDESNVCVVSNPVVDAEFFKKMQQHPGHPWLRDKKMKTFVSAGAFVENKGHITILKALKLALERGMLARVIIYGSGPLEQTYRKFICDNHLKDYVSLPGFTDNLPAEAHAADGYLLSSITESFGLALVEGMACGCPVVATDAPFGPNEILNGGQYGKLVPVGDVEAYSEAIIQLIKGDIKPPCKSSWEPYTVESVVDKYIDGLCMPHQVV